MQCFTCSKYFLITSFGVSNLRVYSAHQFALICSYDMYILLSCRINFFHLCRIVLEDVPGVLRTIFRDEISNKYRKEWVDGPGCGQWLIHNERFQSRLNRTQKQLLTSGKVDEWDVSLLVHALLFSSQLLLADSFRDNQMNVKHNDPCKLVSTSRQADFTRDLRRKDIVLCDVGQELIRNEVKFVNQTEITLKNPVQASQCVVYLCSRDWTAVEELSVLRNTHFAHCKNARIDLAKLKGIVQHVKKLYYDLRISKPRIDAMANILTGKLVLNTYIVFFSHN